MVNITIIARDRPCLTEQTLRSVRNTNVEATVTVLDDGSLDETMQIIQQSCALPHPTLKFYAVRKWQPTGSSGAARNLAIRYSQERFGRGDLLYCSDNDVFFREGWLENMITAWGQAQRYGYGILGGSNHPFHGPAKAAAHEESLIGRGHLLEENLTLASQSWLMEWSTWDRFGPLAEPQGVCMSEDHEFCQRVRAAGLKVGHVKPYLVLPTSRLNTFKQPIPGAELIQEYPGVLVL
jgi:glycosyltransferase involved in cell wall biosynthesis